MQGGSVANIFPDSFKGLDIKKKSNVKTPKGEFIIRNCKIVSEQLPLGALYTFKNAESMVLDNNHIGSLAKDTFYSNSKLTNLSISYNMFNSIPESFFSGSHSIEYMRVWGIPWTCSCSDLWFISYVKKNNIVLEGDLVCSSPSQYANKRATWFYWKHCTNSDLCAEATGIVIGGRCFTVMNIVWYVLVLVTSLVACFAFGLVIGLQNYLKQIKALNQGTSLLKRTIAGHLVRVIENKLKAIQKSYAIDKNVYNTQENNDFEVIEDTPEPNTKKKNGEPSIVYRAQENKNVNINKDTARPNTKQRNEEPSTEYTTQENNDFDQNKNTAKPITPWKSNELSEIKRNRDFNERDIVSPLYWRDATQAWLYR